MALLAGWGPSVASAATISFEDLAASAPGPGGHGLVVNTRYNDQGVTFNDVEAYNYSKGGSAIPGFAHSGSVAVETCVAAEFCSAPIAATFTAQQKTVRVWVGYSSPLSAALPVRLTAINAASAVVGTANATLPARTTPTPIQTPLAVDLPSATITRIEVSVPGGYTSGLAVDDVEFSTVGPPPPCLANGPPGVEVTLPGGAIEVQNNGFVLEGSVSPNGAPITSASVIAQSPTTRAAQVYPSLIDADGGGFGPVHFNGILSPGQNLVTVTATNCAGTGTSKIQPVTLSPIPAGASFRQIAPIEVTQGVQNATGSVPLVAPAGYGGKRTYARVPLTVDGASTAITGVSATLNAVREEGTRPAGPQIIHSLNTIRVEPGATFADVRSRLDGMLNFELPPEWLAEGKLHLQIDHIEVEGSQTLIPCKGCDNIDADGPSAVGPSFVKFRLSPPLRVLLVSVPITTTANGNTVAPRQDDIDMTASWLRRAYPSADIQIRQAAMPALPAVPASCEDVNTALRAWAAPTWHPPKRVYGLYGEPFGAIMGGCSDIGGYFGSGPAGAPRPATSPTDKGFAAWDEDASYADAYAGHEIGHMFFRYHPGACENDTGDAAFPYADGLLGSFAHDNVGFDGGDPAFSIPTQLYYWNAGSPAHDVMTYCDDQWPSTYTYTHIMDYMCHGYQPYCLNVPVQARPSTAKNPLDRGAGAGKLRLIVNGSLAPGSAQVSLEPLAALRGPGLSIRPDKSPYSIVLRGAGGSVIARYPFRPKGVSDQPGKRTDSIQEVVRWEPGTRRVEIAKGKKALEAVQVSAHDPVVNVTGPKKRKLARPATVRWRGRDADGDRLTYTLLYSTNGKRFSPVAAGLRKRSFRVDPAELGGGPKARFKVIATDGVNTGSDVSRPLKIAVKAPRVVLTTPAGGSALAAKVPVQLIGTVEDLQDLRFADARVVWRSSIQGVLGEGESITAELEPGTHEITLSATNKAGETGSASVAVKAVAAPPDFEAEVVP